MKTLHAVPCKVCGTRGVVYAGWCVRCLMRGVKSMQAMSVPLMTFLLENHVVQPGDKMPYGDKLLEMLRGVVDAAKNVEATEVRNGTYIDRGSGAPPPGPVPAACDDPRPLAGSIPQ